MVGQTVSHYRILRKLVAGGMGVVYEGEDLKLGRHVALKFLPEDLARDHQAVERFQGEARAASALDHPNICVVHEIGEHEGQLFIAMQYLEGETLRHRTNSGPIPVQKALDYGIQIATGLAAAHDRKIVHRDLKLENIFITREGRVKILDFGLAKVILDTESPGEPGSNPSSLGRPLVFCWGPSVTWHRSKYKESRSTTVLTSSLLEQFCTKCF